MFCAIDSSGVSSIFFLEIISNQIKDNLYHLQLEMSQSYQLVGYADAETTTRTLTLEKIFVKLNFSPALFEKILTFV